MRDLPVGNGSLLINFDDKYQIRDVYFPHVGQENHSEGFPFRFGVWAGGKFSWIFEDDWQRELNYLTGSPITDVRLLNAALQIELRCHDTVASRENVYLKHVKVIDTSGQKRDIRIFLHHDLRIYENKVGDTAFYDPQTRSLIHYKKHRYFLINTLPHFDQFATGRKAFRDMQGTWRDAEDGDLHGGAITEGSVDSTVAIHGRGSFEFYYWIAAGTSHSQVSDINNDVLSAGPAAHFLLSTGRLDNQAKLADAKLSPEIVDLYDRSLHIIRTQIDLGGAIIAANDHDVTERATDHYSYLWPRDGAFVANALDHAGVPNITRKFFDLCSRIVDHRGYFLQKYNPDGSVGSGWHAYWDKYRQIEIAPIQEDETALVLWALWEHHILHPDQGWSRKTYHDLVVKCADFLVEFRDTTTGLPLPSWNLWEDRRGVHTFTCATVVAGLRASANFARLYGDRSTADKYSTAADEVVSGMSKHLYSRELGRFLRGLLANGDDSLTPDTTVDASLFGLFYFGCYAADNEMVTGTMAAIEEKLVNKTKFGGVARFENDGYMRETSGGHSNSWVICTLWLAEYYIALAKNADDLSPAFKLIEWVTSIALPSGVLPEQIDSVSGKHLSVSPLTWSHSTFVTTVLSYAAKLQQIEP